MLRRKRELTAGVLGATALFAAQAQAAPFVVNLGTDGVPSTCDGTCTLRDAITDANASAGDDTISFAPSVTGLIRLTQGVLPISSNQGLTITGPGRSVLTVSGDANNSGTPNPGDSRVFNISLPTSTTPGSGVTISGLTLTNGFDPSGASGGGAVFDNGSAPLTISDSAITNSISGDAGGGIAKSSGGGLAITGSTISGNTGLRGGGITDYTNDTTKLLDSTVSDNHAVGDVNNSRGGGILEDGDTVTIERTTISGNTADAAAGGIAAEAKYRLNVNNSTISGNTAPFGGGMTLSSGSPKYASARISETTISGNHGARGAGVGVRNLNPGSRATIARSTISGNEGGANSWGGGILLNAFVGGAFELVDSTVSGNSATAGGGVSLGSDGNVPVLGFSDTTPGTADFDNSTIAGNSATSHGGGIYLSQYDAGSPTAKTSPSPNLTSTIVAGNTAAGAGQDLDRVDTSTAGGFIGAFSLVQAPGDAPVTQHSMLMGVDPQLGALGDHGGPTATMVPAGTSPAIDQGRSTEKLDVDQRNAARLVDTAIPNAPSGGDGTDIGAIELVADLVPPPPKATFTVTVRGKPISPGTPLLPASLLPLDCAITVVSMTSCDIELRSAKATKLSKKTTIAKNTLLAEGIATSGAGASQLSVKVKLTSDGRALLKSQPLGVDTLVDATAATDASSALIAKGVVHLLSGPSVTLGLGKRSTKLPKTVNKRLDQLAKLIPDAKTVTCTGFSDKGKGDVTLTKKQATAACKRLVKDGVKGKVTSTGKGHAKPVASNKTKTGRALNRRLVVKFTL